MEILVSDFISWQYFILLLLVILFFIWIFWGGGNYEYVGYAPLKIGINAAEINTKKDEEDNFSDIEYSQDVSQDNFSEYSQNYSPNNSQNHSEETLNSDDSFKKVYMERVFKPTREKEKVTKLTYSHEIEEPKIKNLVKEEVEGKGEGKVEWKVEGKGEKKEEKVEEENEKSPRSLALGEFSCYGGNKMSKGESLCKKAIEDIYGVPFYCIRPNFLKNPETGRNLELDLYNDSLKIAVEYNGMQHSVFPNSFHKTYEEFINQVRRDQYKIDTCDKNGIYLITVPHTVPTEYEEIRKYIEYYLPENHAKRLEDSQK